MLAEQQVEQQPPLELFVCDHAGLVINKLSQIEGLSTSAVLSVAASSFMLASHGRVRAAVGCREARDATCTSQFKNNYLAEM